MDFHMKRRSVWVIEVNGSSYMAGVSIAQNRILTWAADVITSDKCTVFGRRLYEDGFIHELQTVHLRSNWGLRMLKCKNPVVVGVGGGEFSNISQDETLQTAEKLFHSGHPHGLIGSGFIGCVSRRCIEVDPLSFSQDYRVCNDHRGPGYERVPYRKMGDFVNVDTFLTGATEDNEFNRQLHPMVPVIHCGRIRVETGNFGGPLYKTNGDIVGIVTHRYWGQCMAVHVSAIKAFVAEADAISKVGFKARFQRSIGGIKRGGWPRDQAVSGPPGA